MIKNVVRKLISNKWEVQFWSYLLLFVKFFKQWISRVPEYSNILKDAISRVSVQVEFKIDIIIVARFSSSKFFILIGMPKL